MKKSVLYLIILITQMYTPLTSRAQDAGLDALIDPDYNPGVDSGLVAYDIPLHSTTHFISKEPISYIDISTDKVEGDLPEDHLARIRPVKGQLKSGDRFTVTIVTPIAVTVYKLRCVDEMKNNNATHVIKIYSHEGVSINNEEYFKEEDFLSFAGEALEKKRRIFNITSTAFGLTLSVSNIFIFRGHILCKIQLKNRSKIPFEIDEARFKIRDRKILNTTVSQDIELKPVYALKENDKEAVLHTWKNVYAFKKFTYPENKVFTIEFSEKQISGRKISVDIDYNQLLQVDALR